MLYHFYRIWNLKLFFGKLLNKKQNKILKIKHLFINLLSIIHRMRRTTFQFLLELLTPHLIKRSDKFGRCQITPEKQLMLSIWMMATPNSYR